MLDDILDIARSRLSRVGRPPDAEEAESLVAERAPGEAAARWTSGRDDEDYLLWVATEGRVLLLEQDGLRRKVHELAYSQIHEAHVSRDRWGARIRLYAGGRKYALEGADTARAEALVQWIRDRMPGRARTTTLDAHPGSPIPAASTPPAATGEGIASGLAELVRLRERGLLTEEEFTAFKQRLLRS